MANQSETGWLKRFVPRGIYGRAALILFLPVVVVTLVVSVMFLQRHFDGVTRQMTASMARELTYVSQQMNMAANSPASLLTGQSIGAPLGLSVYVPAISPRHDRRMFYDFSGRAVIQELRDTVPNIQGIDLATNDKRVAVRMKGRNGAYTIAFDRRRVSASNPHQLLVLMMFTSLLMTGIATIFLRNQLRPIRRLAQAAEEYGKGRMVPYRPSGATEVRSAGTAFLDMRNRLERQNDQRKLMISGISHDLRTPLTRMRLAVSMMSQDAPPDDEDIAAMESDIAEMNRMVDAFLDYTRDEALEDAAEPTQVKEFLSCIVADAARAGRDVELLRVEGDAEGLAKFRPDMLRRAIDNLIGNAARYGTKVQVDAALGPRSLRIGIEDDGPGIAQESHEMVMRPFTRLDTARSRNGGQGAGAGLGLAIAADVARGHGGQLRLGRGSRLGGLRAEIVIPR